MGQSQSSEKPSAHSRSGTPQADRERKVRDKASVQPLSHPRAQPADVSATTQYAVAQGTTAHHVEKPNLHHMLQSTSPELTHKTNRLERSTSRASKKKHEAENRSVPQSPEPVQLTAPIDEVVSPSSVVPLPSVGIDIPTASVSVRTRQDELEDDGEQDYSERSYAPISHHRPPRLPLPIADVPIPESPTLAPIDKSNTDVPIFETDDPLSGEPRGSVRRKSSMLSITTQDEEEIGDELQPFGVGLTGQTVPTVIEWNQPAQRVFVTGTFAAWDKKYRLKRSETSPEKWKTIINLPPGTHHVKFFVDGQMVTSDHLPTAVDFNNILVNYIEISVDDIPRARRESSQPVTKNVTPQVQPQPPQQTPQQPPQEPPQELPQQLPQQPPQHQQHHHHQQQHQHQPMLDIGNDVYSDTITPGDEDDRYEELQAEEIPEGDFRQLIPQALQDVDLPEDDSMYKLAAQIIQDSAAPPSLPLFLSRSILNGTLPVKDDSSVLTLPNHTVLNHLMTSSVRNGVLATSVTTRYKKKYVTTISFKPVPKA